MRLGPCYGRSKEGTGFIRIFGYGLHWKDRSRNRLLFSERNWINPAHVIIGNWHFTFLGRHSARH